MLPGVGFIFAMRNINMQDYKQLVDYFEDFLNQISETNKAKVIEAYKLVDENFWYMPAASGNHHSELQACEHGLLYHIYEGLIALEQLIRSRSDVMDFWRNNKSYEGEDPVSDLITAYLMHDICKFKTKPSGSNYTHDEDAYQLCVALGFNPVVCEVVRYTHGQWSTAKQITKKGINDCKYASLCWLSHYADMVASAMRPMKFVATVKNFDKVYFQRNKNNKKAGDTSIDVCWWSDRLKAKEEKAESVPADHETVF